MATARAAAEQPDLLRALGTWDGALITVGSVVGSAIFLTTSDVARVLPHAGLIVLVWAVGGLLTVAGALTYAELGAMFPRAGGQYHFLKEAYGPLWAFLFGWASFLVIMSGGIATLGVGFGEYLGSFVPFFSTGHILFAAPIGPWRWTVSGGQLAAVLAIALLTAVNYVGLKEGAWTQNVVTILKIGAIAVLVVFGLAVPAPARPDLLAPLPPTATASALGVAMIGVLWGYDGWYCLTFTAGEMRDPRRKLPLALLSGTVIVTALYVLLNVVYVRALAPAEMAASSRVGEAAAAALFGPRGARLLSAAVLVSIFGCLSSNILTCARIYLPMAQDGLFFHALARVHPRYHTPGACLVAQAIWSAALALSGTFEQLYTYVVFAGFMFHAMTGAAVFVLRRARPNAQRPYRVWGYPFVPIAFIATALAFVANTLVERPTESGLGLVLVGLGLPAYAWWRRR
jgi:APA family basic amino acid/polyamine antiporter